jgi:hypothetical protein
MWRIIPRTDEIADLPLINVSRTKTKTVGIPTDMIEDL